MNVQWINPFINATTVVFATMLDCQLERGQPGLYSDSKLHHDLSGVIGLSGKVSGTVVLGMDRDVAMKATERMLLTAPTSVDQNVIDAVGELTNMIAGKAKADLEQFQMSLGLPTVIAGADHAIGFGSRVVPITIPFQSSWGMMSLSVGMAES